MIIIRQLFLVFALLLASCTRPTLPSKPSNFAFEYKCGVDARNVLNTFTNTFTYDLVENGTVTIPLTLSDSEMTLMWNELAEVDFFHCPDTMKAPEGAILALPMPFDTYDLIVRRDSVTKHVRWWGPFRNGVRDRWAALSGIDTLVWRIIIHHPEFAKLPRPKGGYM